MTILNRTALTAFFDDVASRSEATGEILLVGATSHVWEGHLARTSTIEICFGRSGQPELLESTCRAVAEERGVELICDSPGEYIPLPQGHDARSIPVSNPPAGFAGRVTMSHFDPYSVAFRFIARGDEPDYHIALASLNCGWITDEELDAKLETLLPRFTKDTIQQDPAEFRRKYKGLTQLRRATRPGLMHRFTPT